MKAIEQGLAINTDIFIPNHAPESPAIDEPPLRPWNEDDQIGAVRRTIEEPGAIPEAVQKEPLLVRTRASRMEAESTQPSDHPLHRFMRKPVLWGAMRASDITEWALELSPLRFIWGPGDLLSLTMGLLRKHPLTGEHIDPHEAKWCLVAAVIPFIPSKAILGPIRMARRFLEDSHHALRTGDFRPIRNAMTVRNAARLVLAFL